MTDGQPRPAPWVPPVAQPVPPPVIVPLVPAAPVQLAPVQPAPVQPVPVPPVTHVPQPRRPRRSPVLPLAIGGAAFVALAFVVTLAVLFVSILVPPSYEAAPGRAPDPEVAAHAAVDAAPTASVGGPGQTLTTAQLVSITVQKPSCYASRIGDSEVVRRCSVPVRIANDGQAQIKVTVADFTLIAGARYPADAAQSLVFGAPRSSRLDPSTSGSLLLWFEVAADAGDPTALEFHRLYVVDTALRVEFPATTVASPVRGADTASLGSTLRPSGHSSGASVAVTVHTVECGVREAPDAGRVLEPDGEFCVVGATVRNEGAERVRVGSNDFQLVTETTVTTSSTANRFGAQQRSAWADPGESIDCTLFFDVPVGTAPTAVRFARYGDDAVTFTIP